MEYGGRPTNETTMSRIRRSAPASPRQELRATDSVLVRRRRSRTLFGRYQSLATIGHLRGTDHGLGDLGDLGTSSDNVLIGRVVHIGDILVLKLGTLPDLNLAAAAEDTDTHD